METVHREHVRGARATKSLHPPFVDPLLVRHDHPLQDLVETGVRTAAEVVTSLHTHCVEPPGDASSPPQDLNASRFRLKNHRDTLPAQVSCLIETRSRRTSGRHQPTPHLESLSLFDGGG